MNRATRFILYDKGTQIDSGVNISIGGVGLLGGTDMFKNYLFYALAPIATRPIYQNRASYI